MALEIEEPAGETPLTPEDLEGLLVPITTRGELNEVEAENISKAMLWLKGARPGDVLTEGFVFKLHTKMYGEVWKWAGTQRARETTIGVLPHQIAMRLRDVLADTRFWVDNKTFPIHEIAIRYHHRLVQVHPFRNGNGRHARQAADDLMVRNGGEPLRWGGGDLANKGEARDRYIAALQEADRANYEPLLEICR